MAVHSNEVLLLAISVIVMGLAYAGTGSRCTDPNLMTDTGSGCVGFRSWKGPPGRKRRQAGGSVGIEPGILQGRQPCRFLFPAGCRSHQIGEGMDEQRILSLSLVRWGIHLLHRILQSRLLPRWLSVWGILGLLLMLSALFPDVWIDWPIFSTLDAPLFPIMLQEMALAVWLIVKGFNPSVIASLSSKTETN